MPSRRSQIEMTPDEVARFLTEGRKTLNIATIGPSGHPHLVAMWFAMRGPKPVFWTFGKSQKVRNIEREPKMSALVESGTVYSELRGVELVGIARLVRDYDEIVKIGLEVAERYNGPEAVGDAGRAFVEKQAQKRIGVVLDVDKVVSWDHTKLGGRY
jgi:PPOX class probable F420-dependent enzyme